MKMWWILAGAAAAALVGTLFHSASQKDDEPAIPDAVDEAEELEDGAAEESVETTIVPAVIKSVRHDHDPVTLSGWTRLVCSCEDGTELTMSFSGNTGVYLTVGERGLLEHREGAFVSFEKENGEIVTPMYHMTPEAEE